MTETDFLICPICASELKRSGGSLVCAGGKDGKKHCFDISASGYSDLSYRSGGSGDSKEAVNDRTLFLDKGYYSPLSDEINRLCSVFLNETPFIVDAGCGEGYYSEKLADSFPCGFVFGADLSKHAVRRASIRRNQKLGKNSYYAVSSVFSLPIKSETADCVVSMFAPVAETEVNRVLKEGGYLIVGSAGRDHLYELKKSIYDSVRLNDERADMPESMLFVCKSNISYKADLNNHEDIMRLFGMTPYKFRTSVCSMQKLSELERLCVEINVDFHVFQKCTPKGN